LRDLHDLLSAKEEVRHALAPSVDRHPS
jgi:hypothetical protein